MAIEREIPKDISKYEAKVVGPLTTRQLVCTIPGAAIAVGSFFLFKNILPSDVNGVVSALLASPFFLCGWVKMYGVPFEKYISIIFVSQVLAPKHRKYRTENTYAELGEERKPKKPDKKKDKIVRSGEFAKFE